MGAHDILKMYLERKKLAYPQYSLRALARDVALSPAYVSAILGGKRPLPAKKIKNFIKILDLDDVAILQLKRTLTPVQKTELPAESSLMKEDDRDFFNRYRPMDKKKYSILSDWYNVAILDMVTCQDFIYDPEEMARKLRITRLELEMAMHKLSGLGLLKKEDGLWKKVDLKVRFPTQVSEEVVRKFHKQMIKKAYEELDAFGEEDFKGRLIAGSTFALDEEKIQILKEKIQNALYEVATMASEGPSHAVYQFNVQFFPLAK